MLGGQVAETDVEIRLDCPAVFLFLPNPAGVAFAQETRITNVCVCVEEGCVRSTATPASKSFRPRGFSLRPPESTRQKLRKKARVCGGFRHHTRRHRSLNPSAGA